MAEHRKLAFTSSSTTAELFGLHLAADPLADYTEAQWAIILCNSRATLLRLKKPQERGPLLQQLARKLRNLKGEGRDTSPHRVPSHVGLEENKRANSLDEATHWG